MSGGALARHVAVVATLSTSKFEQTSRVQPRAAPTRRMAVGGSTPALVFTPILRRYLLWYLFQFGASSSSRARRRSSTACDPARRRLTEQGSRAISDVQLQLRYSSAAGFPTAVAPLRGPGFIVDGEGARGVCAPGRDALPAGDQWTTARKRKWGSIRARSPIRPLPFRRAFPFSCRFVRTPQGPKRASPPPPPAAPVRAPPPPFLLGAGVCPLPIFNAHLLFGPGEGTDRGVRGVEPEVNSKADSKHASIVAHAHGRKEAGAPAVRVVGASAVAPPGKEGGRVKEDGGRRGAEEEHLSAAALARVCTSSRYPCGCPYAPPSSYTIRMFS
ncbi:hypothetical protein FB451DRAFT_1392673 [Mycena latifolia]|nr:hypothetical protein FB451DRAFT_1392673 [Mycena latifolia]